MSMSSPDAVTEEALDEFAVNGNSQYLDPEERNRLIKNKYIKDKKIGEGTYANVYLGHLATDSSSLVAIKKIKVNAEYKDGISMDAIREMKFLQELHHPNIIALHDIFSSKNQNINFVLEYLPLGDLEMLIKDTNGVRYGSADIKAWMVMLGRAVWFCHSRFVLHRDIKPNNLLIAADGEIKLADFGLARNFADPYRPMTSQVITRWYRPPELLLGAQYYSGAVDVWSVGTVFAELILRTPYLAGSTDLHQMELICQFVGSPTDENWPGVSKLRQWMIISGKATEPVRGLDYYLATFGSVGKEGVDLLMKTLALDPRKRPTSTQFLEHRWWRTEPRPTEKSDLPKKAGGVSKIGEDLQRKPGELDEGVKKVARKLDFSNAGR